MNYFTKDKPYNTLNEYYKHKYHNKVAKIALNANFTCPNIDGKVGFGGCTYCSSLGSGDFAGDKNKTLQDQFNDIKNIMNIKWPNALYLPYLQANTNTYKPLNELKKIYEECLNLDKNVIGLSIATRADEINDELIEYLSKLNKKYLIQIELGLQTSNEETAKRINRCMSNETFINTVKKLKQNNIEVVAHIINGLPDETIIDNLNTIKFLNNLGIDGIKIHTLLILKNTKMHQDYIDNNFHILTLKEYVDIVAEQIKLLNENIIIHRLCADGVINDLIEPKWTIKKMTVMNEIDKLLRNNNWYQGMKNKKNA